MGTAPKSVSCPITITAQYTVAVLGPPLALNVHEQLTTAWKPFTVGRSVSDLMVQVQNSFHAFSTALATISELLKNTSLQTTPLPSSTFPIVFGMPSISLALVGVDFFGMEPLPFPSILPSSLGVGVWHNIRIIGYPEERVKWLYRYQLRQEGKSSEEAFRGARHG